MRYWVLIVSMVVGALLAACGPSAYLESPNLGRTVRYEPGVPNFDLEARIEPGEEGPRVVLMASIPHVSLVYVPFEGGHRAVFELIARVMDERGREIRFERAFADTLSLDDPAATRRFGPHLVRRRLDIAPGRYLLDVTLVDAESGATATRRQRLDVPDPASPRPLATGLALAGRRGADPYRPQLALHLPGDLDSLRAEVALMNLPPAPFEVVLSLVRFVRDTTVAGPPYWLMPARGTLAYRGADARRPDTLQVTRREVTGLGPTVEVVFALPRLDPGLYRLHLVGQGAPDATRAFEQERDFAVVRAGFPYVRTLDQMIEALAYIAFEREVEAIRAGATAAERRRRFDAFWGARIPNRSQAQQLLRLYYERIEEANRLFSSVKEGWKTDRGMIYTVLGPPQYVEHRFDREVWHYSYAESDPLGTFTFERVRVYALDAAFDTYVLQRRATYDHAWFEAVERWRRGRVL